MPPVRLMADLENILEFDQNETNTLDNVIETELSKQKKIEPFHPLIFFA